MTTSLNEGWTRYTFPTARPVFQLYLGLPLFQEAALTLSRTRRRLHFKIVNDYTGDGWNDQVDDEMGNFDYLDG